MEQFEHAGGSYRGRTGSIDLPDELTGIVDAVLGLDNRPQAKPHFRSRPSHGNVQWRASSASFTPIELASLYNFPQGTGQGIIEPGGRVSARGCDTAHPEAAATEEKPL